MAVDSLVVGLLAALVGAALQIGHAAAPGLGGWRRDPRTLG
jgi:F0F1-type ATP synthase membrane subunit c/vacuolar-type H+-ATPase subunit K